MPISFFFFRLLVFPSCGREGSVDGKTKKPVSEPSWCGLGWASREKSGSFAWTTTDGDDRRPGQR